MMSMLFGYTGILNTKKYQYLCLDINLISGKEFVWCLLQIIIVYFSSNNSLWKPPRKYLLLRTKILNICFIHAYNFFFPQSKYMVSVRDRNHQSLWLITHLLSALQDCSARQEYSSVEGNIRKIIQHIDCSRWLCQPSE